MLLAGVGNMGVSNNAKQMELVQMNNGKLGAALQSLAMIIGAAGIATAHPDASQITSLIQPTIAAFATLWGVIANHKSAQ